MQDHTTVPTPLMQSLRAGYSALVLGASGAIGQAFVTLLQSDPRCASVTALSRSSQPGFDLSDPASLERLALALAGQGPFQLVIDATGALTLNGRGPEKRLDELDAQALQDAMSVNAIGPALLLKQLLSRLASGERVIWAKLSARVGSLEDNRKGGWYGYRASKAALNMLLQTAAIEIARRRPLAVIAALQPGTVRSGLSQPFVGEQAQDPLESAGRLLRVLDALEPTGRAQFVDHAGQSIPW
ncbi:SDR family NAD(P)-dependent oxidoreductase [Malikia spinosa]|uniref:SDR family NAD(P)-dependent oxidoreductase n=1 Tax=Malikia spinosa TaxID=86180 RepID=UPI000A59F5BF